MNVYTPIRQRREPQPTLLSIVVPAFNEEATLDALVQRVSSVMGELKQRYELIFVNDGSTDMTLPSLMRIQQERPEVGIVNLSRNFGKEIALTAGLDYASGDAVVVLDADLQDPPELIPVFLDYWRQGFDVVYGQRISRAGETWFKKKSAEWFYAIMARLGPVEMPQNAGDFRLMSDRVVFALRQLPEQHRFMKGLFAWVGFPQKAVPYHRDPRHAGKTKWNYWKLWNFSLEGLTSYTTAPLRAATYIGLSVALCAFLYGLWIVFKTILLGDPVQGFPTVVTAILFLGGLQLIGLGLIGEYLGRVFNETKRRPLYFVERFEKPKEIGSQTEWQDRQSTVSQIRQLP